jgi:hypothetical protein
MLSELTEAERRVLECFPRGEWVDLREGDPVDDLRNDADWGPERGVRAELLRTLLLGGGEVQPGHAPGLRLRGARITGRLDLMGAGVNCPLVCEYCLFDSEIRLVEASVKTVRIVDSRMPSLNATRMRLDGILNLWGCMIPGVPRLDQAKVTGQVCLRGAHLGHVGAGQEALAADALQVDGGLDCLRLQADGSVSLQGARITGLANFTGTRISYPDGRAFALDYADIGGRLDCSEAEVEGQASLHNTRVAASVVFNGAQLNYPQGEALSAGGVRVGGGLFFLRGFTARGGLRLVGAKLAANLSLTGASLINPGAVAVMLDHATMTFCNATELTCAGTFSLTSAEIAGGVDLTSAHLDAGPGNLALAADGISIGDTLVLTQLHAQGQLSLRAARIARGVLLTSATLDNPGQTACRLSGAEIAGDVIGRQLTVTGGLRLTGAKIGGRLTLDQVRLHDPGGTALAGRGLEAGRLSLRPAAPIQGTVNLSHARIGVIRDDPATWPAQLSLDGLTYQALEPRLPARQRLPWLARDPAGHQAQPYEHLASCYVSIGQPTQARTVWYARERLQRRTASPLTRAWGIIQDITLGYGYRPWRALAWLALLLAAGSITFALSPPPPLQTPAPHFNPLIYTLDLLLPVVNLGQKYAYNPAGPEQWLSYFLMAAGWILVSTIAAGAARVLRRS